MDTLVVGITGFLVTQDVSTSTPMSLTTTAQKVVFTTVNSATTDATQITIDASKDTILVTDNVKGYNVVANFSVEGLADKTTSTVFCELFADGVLIDSCTHSIYSYACACFTAQKYVVIDPGDEPETLTIKLTETAGSCQMNSVQLRVQTNYTVAAV